MDGQPQQFGTCPDYFLPLEQAHIVAEYVGGNFTIFDALDMAPEDFKQVFTVAAAKKVAQVSMAKQAKAKAQQRNRGQ